ncbi:WD40 repeat domain-containing protein [Dictyobacter arantiisoli]|uniref:WD40 repeat domain-containing protein n=1 Tax=Dictyobacter arantiisoli TaxID=2014874 RepID=UPI00155AA170|nr:PD40 domain-containing protein [Dictyobacter arantiisoli]
MPSYDRHEYGASAVAWSPDGRRIASGGAFGEVHVWTAEYSEKHYAAQGSILICRKESHPSYEMKLAGVCWSPDGTRLFAGRHDGWVVCWNTTTGACLLEACRNISVKVNDLSLSPDGTWMAVACQDGEVRVWVAEGSIQGREVVYHGHQKETSSLSWSPDGRMIVSCSPKDEMLHFWDPLTGNLVNQVPLSVYYCHPEPMPKVVRWSPDGAFVAVGCEDGTVQLISPRDHAQVETIWAYTTPVRCLAWSRDGRFLATGSWCANGHSDVHIWRVPSIASNG